MAVAVTRAAAARRAVTMAVVKVASVARAAWLEVTWEVMMARVERVEAVTSVS